jgi:hypothetical protein
MLPPDSSFAQTDRSRWGVSGSFVPTWQVPREGKVLFDANEIVVEGSEFRVGFVRGRDFGGDWGVSFLRETVNDGSRVCGPRESCFGTFGCGLVATQYVFDDVTLTGIEVHKFLAFVTIARRVQIGMPFAGGVGGSRDAQTSTASTCSLPTRPVGS